MLRSYSSVLVRLILGLVLEIGIGHRFGRKGLFGGDRPFPLAPILGLLRLLLLLMLEHEHLRTLAVYVRVHVFEEGLVELDEVDVEWGNAEGVDHAVAVLGVPDVYQADLEMGVIGPVKIAGNVQHDRLVTR
jgi:hypothetical protein